MHISRHDRVYQTLANIFLIILVVVIILPFLLLFISSITEEGTLAVSYTHLDVYKRQMLYYGGEPPFSFLSSELFTS